VNRCAGPSSFPAALPPFGGGVGRACEQRCRTVAVPGCLPAVRGRLGEPGEGMWRACRGGSWVLPLLSQAVLAMPMTNHGRSSSSLCAPGPLRRAVSRACEQMCWTVELPWCPPPLRRRCWPGLRTDVLDRPASLLPSPPSAAVLAGHANRGAGPSRSPGASRPSGAVWASRARACGKRVGGLLGASAPFGGSVGDAHDQPRPVVEFPMRPGSPSTRCWPGL